MSAGPTKYFLWGTPGQVAAQMPRDSAWTPLTYAGGGRWLSRCKCGVEKIKHARELVDGSSKSCMRCCRRRRGSVSGEYPSVRLLCVSKT